MEWLWTWGGRCFGYRDEDDLWTYDGKHVGRFSSDEVYAPDGQYLGEIIRGKRLITNKGKKSWRRSGFTPYAQRGGYAKYATMQVMLCMLATRIFLSWKSKHCERG